MAVRIVRLGTARVSGEGTRIGTVRRPPRIAAYDATPIRIGGMSA